MTGAAVVELRDVHKAYGANEVLHGVDLTLTAGRARALVGENGAGKSTLVGVVAGKTQGWTGEYLLRGETTSFGSIGAAQDGGIALIHQETVNLPTLTVAENVMAGRIPRRLGFVDRRALHRQAAAALDTLGVELDLGRPASSLGAAELQLVDIARALLSDPAVLLLDEPTASLPRAGREQLFDVVRRLLEQDTAVVLISHHLDEVMQVCDDITILRDGSVIADVATTEVTQSRVTELMIGRELADTDRAASSDRTGEELGTAGADGPTGTGRSPHGTAPAPALELEDVSDGSALRGVDLVVQPGEIVAVSGLLGAGQKQLVGAVLGAVPVSGTMRRHGKAWRPSSIKQAVNDGVAVLTEDRKVDGLVLDRSIVSNVGLASTLRRGMRRYDPSAERAEAQRLVESLQVKCNDTSDEVGFLSGGNQQKVALAKWLREDKDLFILDEPTRGVDVGAKALIHDRIRELADAGAAVLLVSSDLPEVVALADRAIVLHRGQVVRGLAAQELDEETLLAAASGGQADVAAGGRRG